MNKECPICGNYFKQGERVIKLPHMKVTIRNGNPSTSLQSKENEFVHRDCLYNNPKTAQHPWNNTGNRP